MVIGMSTGMSTAAASIPAAEATNLRLYAWVPRSEVVYIQATLDAYEGIARVRTERQTDNKSLLLFLTLPNNRATLFDLMRQLSDFELSGPVEWLESSAIQ